MKFPVLIMAVIASVALVAPAAAAVKKHKKAASPPSAHKVQMRSGTASDPNSVYVSGEYIGRDPDPNIRAYMFRNPHIWDGPQ
jgi:hypothetical protein